MVWGEESIYGQDQKFYSNLSPTPQSLRECVRLSPIPLWEDAVLKLKGGGVRNCGHMFKQAH